MRQYFLLLSSLLSLVVLQPILSFGFKVHVHSHTRTMPRVSIFATSPPLRMLSDSRAPAPAISKVASALVSVGIFSAGFHISSIMIPLPASAATFIRNDATSSHGAPIPAQKQIASPTLTLKNEAKSKLLIAVKVSRDEIPKSVEDIALEGAINDRTVKKARLANLQAEIKELKGKEAAAKSDANKLKSQVSNIDNQLRKKSLDGESRRSLLVDKSEYSKDLTKADAANRVYTNGLRRAYSEADVLRSRLTDADVNIDSKRKISEKRRESIARDLTERAANDAKKVAAIKSANFATSIKTSDSLVSKAQSDFTLSQANVKVNLQQMSRDKIALENDRIAQKSVTSKLKFIEDSLKKQQSLLFEADKKISQSSTQLAHSESEVTRAQQAVKVKLSAVVEAQKARDAIQLRNF